jgi:hypothetical protein
MRKAILIISILSLITLIIIYYPRFIEKPLLNGEGSLAVHIDPKFPVPETHNPLDWWQTHHMDVVNRGEIEKTDCLYCHEPEKSCNNCHGYVGVDPILTPTPNFYE